MKTRFNTHKNICQWHMWQSLHLKHFVNVLLIHHIQCSREKEIHKMTTMMRHGLVSQHNNLQTDGSTSSLNAFLDVLTSHSDSEKSLKSVKTNKISDIFQPLKRNADFTTDSMFILIHGAPGMGKTTLCNEIAYQWAENNLLMDTELLILIYLRDPVISFLNSLEDLIHYFYKFDEVATEPSKQCAKVLSERHGSGLTIILDGFEEFDNSSNSVITKIMDHRILPQCRIVVTSCPTASYMLQSKADVTVQVMGFNDESKRQYIEQEINDPDKIDRLESYLDEHASIRSICCIPMMMAILVCMYKEKGYLPNNSSELYDTFIAFTICHHLQKQNKVKSSFVKLEDLPTECKALLFNLAHFAFLTLKNEKKVFSKEDFEIICPSLATSELETLGIVKFVDYFSIDKCKDCTFSFLHLSIHEYLAAYYISCIDHDGQFTALESTFLNTMYKETWNMFAALNKNDRCLNFQNYSIYCEDTTYYKHLSDWVAAVKSSIFECFVQLYDIMSANRVSNDVRILFCQCCNREVKGHKNQIYLSFHSPKNVRQTKLKLYIITEHAGDINWDKIIDEMCQIARFSIVLSIDHALLTVIRADQHEIVDCLNPKTWLRYVKLIQCRVSQNIMDAIKLACLKQLQIINCTFEPGTLMKPVNCLPNISTLIVVNSIFSAAQADAICSVIESSKNLQYLSLVNNNLQHDTIKIAKALEHIRTLKVLSFTNNNIPKSAGTSLSTVISLNTSLTVFCMENSKLKSSIIGILENLNKISSLTQLDLNNNQIPKEAGKAIASVILSNSGLTCLVLSDNNISVGILDIAKALQKISTLQVLDLGNTNVPKEISKELAAVIECNRNLNTVKLYNNDLQSSAITILQALSKLSSLRSLELQSNQLNEECGEYFSSIISNNGGLNQLLLNDNNIGKGVLHIAKSLKEFVSLEVLNLGNTRMSGKVSDELAITNEQSKQLRENEVGSEYLSSITSSNSGINPLILKNNNLGKRVLHIAKSLKKFVSLEVLNVSNTTMSSTVSDEPAIHNE